VLIVPADKLAGKSEEEILERVWPVVESACRSVEAYARISKSMIKILPVGCEYPRTDKGSVIRQAFYRNYAKEIDETYDKAESGGSDLKQLDRDELREFVRNSLIKALANPKVFDDKTDFFLLGLDSLQAIQMRSDILKTVEIRGHKLSQTVVFDHPSIERLSAYLFALSSDQETAAEQSVESEIYDLVEKYSHKPVVSDGASSSVAVTGASGSLGAHVVAKLVVDPTVSTVYCFVRARSDAEAATRVRSSMIQRRVYHTLALAQRRKIICYAADLSDKNLGLTPETYEKVASGLRSIIHCAWSVNFNMRLSSFEKSSIAGVANLISLCEATKKGVRSAPSASFNFCSSVSTVARATEVPVPERLPEPSWSQDMGYAQSKTVAEHLCARAAENGITARVLRVGQIVADTQHGIWNSTEAIPLMLQAATTIGALPKLRETPSWLPVDTTAESVTQISLSDAGSVFTNVANPKVFDWTSDLLPALKRAGLSFEEVEPQEWVNRLRNSSSDPVRNPPIKLVDFFASKYDKTEFGPSKTYTTDTACSLAPALANAPVLDQQLVDSFVRYFTAGPWAQTSGATVDKPAKTAIFVAGPCGSGKSTLAMSLAQKLKVPFVEGDFVHSRDNVDKMAAGQALTDDDRASWLERLAKRAVESINDLGYDSVVVSCSALRKSYRDALRSHIGSSARALFLDLQCEPQVLAERIGARKDHYMPESLIESQVSAYEAPAVSEVDVLPVDAAAPPDVVLEEARGLLADVGL
jgi:carbohydrate kinase (thermoresistant glucokinase family)